MATLKLVLLIIVQPYNLQYFVFFVFLRANKNSIIYLQNGSGNGSQIAIYSNGLFIIHNLFTPTA
jgi:hypothetical protein